MIIKPRNPITRLTGCLALSLLAGAGDAQEVTIHLANGGEVAALVESVDSASIEFRSPGSRTSARLSYHQIDTIDWPEPDDWTRAMQWFELGRYREALPIFEALADSKRDPGSFYPSPGNFATRAHRRLLDCHRRLGEAGKVAERLGDFEADKMPAKQREVPMALRAWAAAGKEDWEAVVALVTESAGSVSAASEQGIDLAYLEGLAREARGEAREALIAYARAYTLNAATDARLSRMSLERSILLVAADAEARMASRDERREETVDLSELRAQVHLYASLFGRGGLWPEAGESAAGALAAKLTLGEAALGQGGRVEIEGEMKESSSGTDLIEQVTADHMKEVEVRKAVPEAKD